MGILGSSSQLSGYHIRLQLCGGSVSATVELPRQSYSKKKRDGLMHYDHRECRRHKEVSPIRRLACVRYVEGDERSNGEHRIHGTEDAHQHHPMFGRLGYSANRLRVCMPLPALPAIGGGFLIGCTAIWTKHACLPVIIIGPETVPAQIIECPMEENYDHAIYCHFESP